MALRLILAACCFLFAMHEYFRGLVEGAQVSVEWIDDLVQGEPIAGVPLLIAFGWFLIYHVGMKLMESGNE